MNTAGGFWTRSPSGRVVRLEGASAEAIALALEPLPDDAPAIVTYYPRAEETPAAAANAILAELETVAVGLYPAWLPAARELDGPGGAGIAAVRAMAWEASAGTHHFGPFLAHLAERSLRQWADGDSRFTSEARAAGLARVIADSFDRRKMALLVHVPENFPDSATRVLVSACQWLAQHGDFGVWMVVVQTAATELLHTVTVRLPAHVTEVVDSRAFATAAKPAGHAVRYPPIAGRPHPASEAEQLLEAALTLCTWAMGRAWNRTYQAHVLSNPFIVDLCWAEERCVVEIDGPDHRGELKFEADRRRDVQLQLDGYAILRFTNAQILDELDLVLRQLEQFLTARRLEKASSDTEAAENSRPRHPARVDGGRSGDFQYRA